MSIQQRVKPIVMTIPPEVRDDICQRLTRNPKQRVADVILQALNTYQIDLRKVTLEDMKRLLVTATRAAE